MVPTSKTACVVSINLNKPSTTRSTMDAASHCGDAFLQQRQKEKSEQTPGQSSGAVVKTVTDVVGCWGGKQLSIMETPSEILVALKKEETVLDLFLVQHVKNRFISVRHGARSSPIGGGHSVFYRRTCHMERLKIQTEIFCVVVIKSPDL